MGRGGHVRQVGGNVDKKWRFLAGIFVNLAEDIVLYLSVHRLELKGRFSVSIDVDPAAPPMTTPAFAAFVSAGETGALRAAPSGSLRVLEGGGLLLRAQADALLGPTPGNHRVFIALGAQAGSLASVSAGQVQAEAAARGLKVFEFPVILTADAPNNGAQ